METEYEFLVYTLHLKMIKNDKLAEYYTIFYNDISNIYRCVIPKRFFDYNLSKTIIKLSTHSHRIS